MFSLRKTFLIVNAVFGLIAFFVSISGELPDGDPLKYILIIYFASSCSFLGYSFQRKTGRGRKMLLRFALSFFLWMIFLIMVYGMGHLLNVSAEMKKWLVVAISLIGGLLALYWVCKENAKN